jgi:alpha-2,3 sialyltransferase
MGIYYDEQNLTPPLHPKKRAGDSVIVCGNGPSLAKIDYRRFPGGADVFRTNDFFLEKKYYVGRRVDGFYNGGDLSEFYARYFTINELARGKAYDIDFGSVFCDWGARMMDTPAGFKMDVLFRNHLAEVMDISREQGNDFFRKITVAHALYGHFPYTGIFALVHAALLGYKKIYIAGLDNSYVAGEYAYSDTAEVRVEKVEWTSKVLPEAFQWELVDMVMQMPGVELFCLSPDSPAAEHVPLAPVIHAKPLFKLEDKEPRFIMSARLHPPMMPGMRRTEGDDMLDAVSALSDRGDKILNAVSELADRMAIAVGSLSSKVESIAGALDNRRRWPRWVMRLVCCFVPQKKNRHHIMEKYSCRK